MAALPSPKLAYSSCVPKAPDALLVDAETIRYDFLLICQSLLAKHVEIVAHILSRLPNDTLP